MIWSGVPWVEARLGHGKRSHGGSRSSRMDVDSPHSDMSDSVLHASQKISKHSSVQHGCSSPSSAASVVSSPSLSPKKGIRKVGGSDTARKSVADDSIGIKYLKPHVRFGHAEVASESEIEFISVGEASSDDLQDVPLPPLDDPDLASDVPDDVKETSFPKLKRRVQEELTLHRRRGHVPFDSRCVHCVNTRSVVRHARGVDERQNLGPSAYLVQADFFFLGEPGHKDKFLALSEAMTGLIGVAYCGDNVQSTVNEAKRFFQDLGLLTANFEETPVEVLTDAEIAVSSILRHVPCKLVFKKAAPQSHQTIGRVERCVRRYKELFSCVCNDLKEGGLVLKNCTPARRDVLAYVTQTHNHFGTGAEEQGGSRRSPFELCLHKDLPKTQCTVFGAIVHALITDAVREKLPHGNRFVIAAYRYPEFGSLGHVVTTLDSEGQLLRFVTTIRPLKTICWDARYLRDVASDVQHVPAIQHDGNALQIPPAPDSDDPIPVDERLGTINGPPRGWTKAHGPTEGCTACNASSRKGKKHSSSCRNRYLDWLRSQRQSMQSPAEKVLPPEGGPMEPPSSSRRHPVIGPELNPPPGDPMHPTGGIRFHSKQPRVVPDSCDTGDDVMHEPDPTYFVDYPRDNADDVSIASPSEPADIGDVQDFDMEPDGDQMDTSQFVERKLFLWEALTPPPEADWSKPEFQNGGILFPYYIPVKGAHFESTSFELCGERIFLVRPTAAVSEDMNDTFSISEAESGRRTELEAMNRVRVGNILSEADARRLAAERGQSIIPCRWVLTRKADQDGSKICRARCVAQQVASGAASASALGISSSTPSLEGLRVILSCIYVFDLFAETIDISAAFLNSPLPHDVHAVVRLPGDLSMSSSIQAPVYCDLRVAMNGLRAASKAWLDLCTGICAGTGVLPCPTEPTILAGTAAKSRAGVILLVYVDDIIIAATHPDGIAEIREALSAHVKVKTTGVMTNSQGQGGHLHFLGKDITRSQFSQKIAMRVPPTYLQSVFEEFGGDLKATVVPPNILDIVEKGRKDDKLSEEAASRYRRILGKVSWWAQSRPDQAKFLSVLDQGQKEPTDTFEQALRKYLRYVRGIAHYHNVFPTDYKHAEGHSGIFAVCDAAWGASDFEGRCSTTGGAIYWKQCIIKSVSRLQSSIALSSCECELISACQVCQEAMGLRTLVAFVSSFQDRRALRRFDMNSHNLHDLSFDTDLGLPALHMKSDSEACLAVLRSDGLNRKVRHISIAVCYIQRLVRQGYLILSWIPTAECVADILTKILSRALTAVHLISLGICEMVGPDDWQLSAPKSKKKKNEPNVSRDSEDARSELGAGDVHHGLSALYEADLAVLKEELNRGFSPQYKCVLVDVCTSGRKGFMQVKQNVALVVSITKEIPIQLCCRVLSRKLHQLRLEKKPCGMWLSPPCSGGGTILDFVPEPRRGELVAEHWKIFEEMLDSLGIPLKSCVFIARELPKSCKFWNEARVQRFIEAFNLSCDGSAYRCAFSQEDVKAKHEYRVRSTHEVCDQLSMCECIQHASLNQQNATLVGEYPVRLAETWFKRIHGHMNVPENS